MELTTEAGTYQAEIVYQAESDELVGAVVNPARTARGRDGVLFRGRSIDELRSDFADQVSHLEAALAEQGRSPDLTQV